MSFSPPGSLYQFYPAFNPTQSSSVSRKRRRIEDDIELYETLHNRPSTRSRVSSSELMPPPPLPVNRPSRSPIDIRSLSQHSYTPHRPQNIGIAHSSDGQFSVPLAPVPSSGRGTGSTHRHITDQSSRTSFNAYNSMWTPSLVPNISNLIYNDPNYSISRTQGSGKRKPTFRESKQSLNQGAGISPIQPHMGSSESTTATPFKNSCMRRTRTRQSTLNSLSFMNHPYTSTNQAIDATTQNGILNPEQLYLEKNLYSSRPLTQKSSVVFSQTSRAPKVRQNGAVPLHDSSSSVHNHISYSGRFPLRDHQRVLRGAATRPPSSTGPLRHAMRSSMSVTTSTHRRRLIR
jgi:hypothetical protein